ncbi:MULTISPECIES: bifunctional 3-deoxy-7-phosphoheptulonate synthase/chorismate mutase [unclassified Paenibacillus]|uniref:bifunctional 3-deoxy-7-phosphoheptulonate synthase/chorismate mutase n=1 Tax=unclassified Paenibacillus TaxID=185978 RepID=UPI001C11CEFC|nr:MULTISPECIES: bifunctional 3-deoxy-7-phosphoheptulonate synthase/chorismate mutase [unclassified Paenibacillus]MBU5443010.1 bifunctional 3-deoxy-7-phosphoheptulonate synthase/chorismate mutase [Paenibacillus sp. MSJ-34]CAH0118617.1 Protein AroA(G) [Paenibacillus sp. CECT 9249]
MNTDMMLETLQEQLNHIDLELIHILNRREATMREIERAQTGDELAVRSVHEDEVAATLRQSFPALAPAAKPAKSKRTLLVSREARSVDTVLHIKDAVIGGGANCLVAGPCSVESYEQTRKVAAALKENGVRIMRGGAYKPRTSPYDFQGLGVEGLQILREVANEFGLVTISEIVHPAHIETAAQYIDVIQIGARNMQNFELLKAAGDMRMPVLLKRGIAATMEEFLLAAEYIVSRGNTQVMLIERGIRTYEKWTRNTLDISAVPLLKQKSHLPVLVDVSHSTGYKDIMLPCAKAALAAGADGVMVETHPDPASALSDAEQQLTLEQFAEFFAGLKQSGLYRA